MSKEYTVVPCSECKNIKLVKGTPERTSCGRCGNTFLFRETRKLFSTESAKEAREARTAFQAKRNDLEEEYKDVQDELAAVSTEELLENSTRSKSSREIAREALEQTETKEDFIEYITSNGYSEKKARKMFSTFRKEGRIVNMSEGFRVL